MASSAIMGASGYHRELIQAKNQVRALDRELAQARAQADDPVRVRALAVARGQARNRASKAASDRGKARAQARIRDGEISQARIREHQFTQARDSARTQVHARAVALDLAQAPGRDRILALTGDYDRACTIARARGLSYALDLDSALAFSPATDFAGDPPGDRGLGFARDLAADSDLARARDSVLNLTIAISDAADRHPLWHSFSEPVQSLFSEAFGSLLGRIFSLRFTRYPALLAGSAERRPATWTAVLTQAFTAAAGGRSAGHIAADPAALETTLRESVTSLAKILEKPAGEFPASSRPAIMAKRLHRIAEPFFTWAEQPATGKAAAGRLSALCLASEADSRDRTDIGDMFRQIAAGITLLQRRAASQWPASEVIMLAVEQALLDNRAV